MVTFTFLPIVLAFLQLADPLVAKKILGYFITPSRSHFIIHDSLMRGLAANGHQVTVVSFFPPPEKPIANYTSIQLEMSPETKVSWDAIADNMLKEAEKDENVFKKLPQMLDAMGRINRETYTHPLILKLRRESQFDLVAFGWFFNDYQLGLAMDFKCPAVVVASMNALKPLQNLVGNPAGAAFSPMAMTEIISPMDFKHRLLNFGIAVLTAAGTQAMDYFVNNPEYIRNFPPELYPSFDEAKKNVALVLVASHFSQGGPTLNFPSMVEVSGMHIKKKADPLPEKIQQWLDTAEQGVVFFSLGSNLKSSQLPPEKLYAILRVLGRLKERVLWKWEVDELPGKPDNVMTQKWLPQDDVLAHPNVKLFISHCGKGGVTEARYHGVPILGIPFMADQPTNLDGIVAEGWAVPLNYPTLTEKTFEAGLTEALANKSYGMVVKKAAELYRDRPQHPLDTAVYWTEYVMRHKGAKHMQSQAVDMYWFQYYSFDVIATLLVIFWLCFKVNAFVWAKLWRLAFGQKKMQKNEKVKKQ